IEEGDRLLVVGQSEELAALDDLAKGKAVVPAKSAPCQWILIPEDSPFVGKTLAHLDIQRQYGIKAIAIRREGKFISDPGEDIELQVRDRILLCGGYYPLKLLQQSLSLKEQPSMPIVPVVQAAESQILREYLPMDNWREP
ncbi:MAG TPA: TrkA C-terminal domain-containing protein, partial [Phormidium sp.]